MGGPTRFETSARRVPACWPNPAASRTLLFVSLLVEIASRADVSLEAVVRVLTREPVSEADQARVLAVLDQLDAEQTRVLERFALAAIHDTLPRQQPVLEARVVEPEPGPAEASHTAVQAQSAAGQPAPLVQLGAVLGELAEAVRELRRETDAERRERVDDLAVLIDLITKGWEGLDRRLGRLERQLGRLDSGVPAARALPAPLEPPPAPVPPEPGPPEPVPPEPPPPPPEGNGRRGRFAGKLPLVAALALGVGVGAVAALDLPSRSNVSTVVSASTREDSSTRRKAPSPPPTVPRTSSVLGEVATEAGPETEPATQRETTPATTQQRPSATTAPQAATSPRAPAKTTQSQPTTSRTQTRTTAPSTPGFRPSRNWAWPPVRGADYYLVEFFRAGERIYRARPTQPQLRLPDSVVFTPGAYRWTVRAGFGDPAANDLRTRIVDSGFTIGD